MASCNGVQPVGPLLSRLTEGSYIAFLAKSTNTILDIALSTNNWIGR